MNPPVSFSITLVPSRWLTLFTILVYSISIAVITLLQTAVINKSALMMIIIISLMWRWKNTHRCTATQLFPETSEKPWVLVDKKGEQTDAKLVGSLVYRYLIILYFQLESSSRCSILIPYDSVDQTSHRRLRALLQMRKTRVEN